MRRIAPHLIVKWAVGCNVRARGGDAAAPVPWEAGGQTRLLRLAVRSARALDFTGGTLGQWDQYLELLNWMAFSVSHGVFQEAAAETARDLVFCALGHAGFHRGAGGPAAEAFTEAIRRGDPAAAAAWLRRSYRHPEAEPAALMTSL
jgi:hypothetical protein